MAGVNIVIKLKDHQTGAGPGPEQKSSFRFRAPSFEGGDSIIRGVLMLALGVGFYYGFNWYFDDQISKERARVEASMEKISAQIGEVNQKLLQVKSLVEQADAQEIKKAQLQRMLDEINRAGDKRKLILRMVDLMVKQMPELVWLNKIDVKPDEGGKVEISGYSNDLELVGEFMGRLQGAVFFPDWKLVESVNETFTDANKTASGGLSEAKKFTLNAKVVGL